MSGKDFRPRISSKVHRRLRLHYFDKRVNFSNIYEAAIKLFFDDEGDKKEWYSRVEKLSEEKDISMEEALNNIVVSVVDNEGKFKPGAQQIYVRDNSMGE